MVFSAFFPDLEVETFLDKHWPDRVAVGRGPLSRLPRMFRDEGMQHEAALIRRFKGEIQVWSPAGAVVATAEQAIEACQAGKAVYLDHAEASFPEFAPLIGSLERELDLPPGCAFMNVFISGPNAVVPPHFDYDFGMNLLVKGHKTWTMAPNENVEHPLHSMRLTGAVPIPALADYWVGAVPTQMPATSEHFDVTPGDVVFVPRGYWHATEASEACVAIDFAVNPPVWADVMLRHLRTVLYRETRWRRSVQRGAHQAPDDMLSAMKQQLASDILDMSTDDFRGLVLSLYKC